MPERREILALVGISLIAGASGWWWASREPRAQSTQFVDLAGKARSLNEWDGRIRVLNFWATWCAPCREEIPALVRSREKLSASGVEFIGIAIDQVDKVAEFVRSVPISYPVIVGGAAALDLARSLGNPGGGLPFTVILDAKGNVTHRNLGPVTQQKVEEQIRAVLSA